MGASATETASGTIYDISLVSQNNQALYSIWALKKVLADNVADSNVTVPTNISDSCRIEVYHDPAYINRYGGSSTDPAVRAETAKRRIAEEIGALRQKYWDEFGIHIKVNFVEETFTDCITCNTPCNNKDSFGACICEDGLCTGHHSYWQNMLNYMTPRYHWALNQNKPDFSQILRIFYLGHYYCEEQPHGQKQINGATYDNGGLMLMHRFYEDPPTISLNLSTQASEIQTLIHEFGHFYDIEDHYGMGGKTTQDLIAENDRMYFPDCIYGENKDTEIVQANDIICSGCIQTVDEDKYNFME